MTIDADDLIVLLCVIVIALIYFAVGAIFADFLNLTGLAWFGMVAAWPFVLAAILMAFGLVLGGFIGIIKAARGDA